MAYKLIVPLNYTEDELKEIWKKEYCSKDIFTHDNIHVKFYDSDFKHAFYESSKRGQSKNRKREKDMLSYARLEKMLWIKDVLEDKTAEMRVGYDSKTKSYCKNRRVSIVKGNYVVIINLLGNSKATFNTAFVADNSIDKILNSPVWP